MAVTLTGEVGARGDWDRTVSSLPRWRFRPGVIVELPRPLRFPPAAGTLVALVLTSPLPLAAAAPHPGGAPRRSWSLAALLAGAVAIGFAPIFVRLSEVGPSATAFWRVLLALPALGLWAFLTSPPPGAAADAAAAGPRSWRGLVVVGLFFAGDLAVWHWSIRWTSVANATLEANLAPVFVVGFGWLAFGQRVSGKFVLAMLVALAGTLLLVGKNVHLSATSLRGDALGVLTSVFYAGYLLSVRAARTRGWGAAPVMAASGVVTAAVLLPVAMLSGERLLPGTAHGWSVLLGLALLSHVGGQSLIAYALAGLPASFASVGLLVQPPTAALAAWLFLGERLAPGQLAGGALLLGGILLARRETPGA